MCRLIISPPVWYTHDMERTPTLESVRRDALALSRDDRELLAIDLHYTIEKDPGRDEAWAAEVARRVKEVRLGSADLMDWDEAEKWIFDNDDPLG